MVVGLLTVELHVPGAQSLKDKRSVLRRVKDRLKKFNVAVSEIEHHDLWQRARITAACVARDYSGVEGLLDDAERYLHGQEFECVRVERRVTTLAE